MTKTQTLDCKLLKIIFKVDLLWFYNLESKTSKGRIEKNMAICICNQAWIWRLELTSCDLSKLFNSLASFCYL